MTVSRRMFVGCSILAVVLSVQACSRPVSDKQAGSAGEQLPSGSVNSMAMTVHKDPNCGCCDEWVKLAKNAGFATSISAEQDMQALKMRLGVPRDLQSCHTAEVGGYVVEGHVSLADVRRLLATRPATLRGLAVPGMPRGSPGMEVPDGTIQPFDVIGFDGGGKTVIYSTPATRRS